MEIAVRPRVERSEEKVQAAVDQWASLFLIGLAVLVILPGLGAASLVDWDESIYAQVSREMVQSGDGINLSHGYRPYFEKPPLLMWAIALSYQLFGVSEFWVRLPSAISGILLVYVTFLCGRVIYGNWVGWLAGLILLGSWGYVYQARNGTTNMPLSLFVMMGVYGYLRLRTDSQKWWYLVLASCALAFMVKFWAGLVLPIVLVIALLLDHKLVETLRSRHFWGGLLLAGAIVVPWHLLVYIQNGQALLDSYISRNLLERMLTPLEGHSGSTFYYVDVMRSYFPPWFFLIPFAIVIGIREWMEGHSVSGILVLLVLLVLALYTFVVNTKLPIYILPVFPALALLTSRLFVLASSKRISNEFIFLVCGSLFALLVAQNKLLVLGGLIGIVLIFLLKKGILPMDAMYRTVTGLIFTGFLMSGVIGYVQGNNRISVWSIYQIQDSPISQIAALAGEANPSKSDPIIGYSPPEKDRGINTSVEGPAAVFYSNRPVNIAKTWEDLEQLLTTQETGEIIIAEKYLDRLSIEYDLLVVERVEPLVYARFER